MRAQEKRPQATFRRDAALYGTTLEASSASRRRDFPVAAIKATDFQLLTVIDRYWRTNIWSDSMHFTRAPLIRTGWPVALPVLLLAATGSVSAARAENLYAKYSIRLLGVPLGMGTLSGVVDSGAYRIEATARLTGVATVVSNAKGAATASGLIQQGRVASNGFATTSASAQFARTIRIALQGGNVRASEITPPFDSPPDRIPVTEAQKRNVMDPLSALLMPVATDDTVIGPAACNRNIPVFDGWTRFDVSLAYQGVRDFHAKGYTGPVAVCGARYTPVSGHRDRPQVRYMAENKSIDTWLAPVGSTRVAVPLRISVDTQIGMLIIEATDFSATSSAQAAQR